MITYFQFIWSALPPLSLSHDTHVVWIYRDRLGAATSEYAVLASEPSHSGASTAGRASREKHVEMLFETFGVPAAFLSKAAVLASFAVAKQTGVVVDMGHQATTGEGLILDELKMQTQSPCMALSKLHLHNQSSPSAQLCVLGAIAMRRSNLTPSS